MNLTLKSRRRIQRNVDVVSILLKDTTMSTMMRGDWHNCHWLFRGYLARFLVIACRFSLHGCTVACWTILVTSALVSHAQDTVHKVPILYCTDLFHPYVDPDDHFNLATLFAIEEFDIRGIVLENGVQQYRHPGKIPLEQMMRLTGRRIPYEIGLGEPLKTLDDDGRDQPDKFQNGVELILDVLRKSPEKVTIFTTGSLRDLAAAFNRDRKLFRQKAGRIYINIADSEVRRDCNVDLDVHAWISIMRSGLSIYWCARHDGGDRTRGRGYATWWQFPQHQLLMQSPVLLQKYFTYALSRVKGDNPLAYLSQPLSRQKMYRAFQRSSSHSHHQRSMWCTAPMLHAAGRKVVKTAEGGWAILPDPVSDTAVTNAYTFIPVRVSVDDQGAAAIDFQRQGDGQDMFLFKLIDMKTYDEVMAGGLQCLFQRMRFAGAAATTNAVKPEPLEAVEEWRRTDPDATIYLPRLGKARDGDNESLCVFKAPKSDELLATWTQSSKEGFGDNRMMIARSRDGIHWSAPTLLAGTRPSTHELQVSWGVPIVSKQGRIYLIYLREMPRSDNSRQECGAMGCAFSDDNGLTWIIADPISLPRDKFDHPDPSVPVNWWLWTVGTRDRHGRYILGYTRMASYAVRPKLKNNKWVHNDTRCAFMRFTNLDEGPDPKDLRIDWLPADGAGLEVPDVMFPHRSVAQEPSVVLLPDGRLITLMRTMTGMIYYSISKDDGDTWRKPEPLRYRDDGMAILHPMAPCPLFPLEDGRYLLLFHNNDGSRGWFSQWKPRWQENEASHLRNPAFLAVGKFHPEAHQPIWFSPPKLLLDTHGVIIGPKRTAEVATYASLTEWHGRRMLWYPDRKYFLLGKEVSDKLLDHMKAP